MPFTFSHPALVIPLFKNRFRLSVTGLVMGSMVPDFEFILQLKAGENIGHHWLGILLFDLPVSLLLSLLYHGYVRDSLIDHLPNWYRVRLNRFTYVDWIDYARHHKLVVLASICIGIGTHFFWDAFTHYDGAFVEVMPLLKHSFSLFQAEVPGYLALQIISSVWGLWMVQRLLSRQPVRAELTPGRHLSFWTQTAALAAVVLLMRLVLLPNHLAFWDLFFASMGSLTYALIGSSLLLRYRRRTNWQAR